MLIHNRCLKHKILLEATLFLFNQSLIQQLLEILQVSQLLIAVDSGNVNEWKGRKLKDISTDGMQ